MKIARFLQWVGAGMICVAGLGAAYMAGAHEGHRHASLIKHDEAQVFEMNGNHLRGIATVGTGAEQFEVWRSNVAVGSSTPRHTHDSEEVFVFLRGKVRAVIGDEEIELEAPCTLVAPAKRASSILERRRGRDRRCRHHRHRLEDLEPGERADGSSLAEVAPTAEPPKP